MKGRSSSPVPPRQPCPGRCRAFTLIEIMIVVAIMAIVMSIAIPSVYRKLNAESMDKAVSDILDACRYAREHAILQGVDTDLTITDKQFQGTTFTATLSEKIAIEALEVNSFDVSEGDGAIVRFYPDGTCDDMKLILFRPDTGERRGISLEFSTAMADVETDLNKWLK